MKELPKDKRLVSPPSLVFCLGSEPSDDLRIRNSFSNQLSQIKVIPPGETIFSSGQLPKVLYILRQGRASLIGSSSSGQSRPFRTSLPNEIFGITESLGETPFDFDLVAADQCSVEQIDRQNIEDLLLADGRSIAHVIQALSHGIHLCHIVAREL